MNIMKRVFLFLALFAALTACEEEFDSSVPCWQGVEATVRDLTGLDGCGYVFELNDGTKLEPLRMFFCGTPPLPKEVTEDPLYQFEFEAGKRVIIGYDETKAFSACMAGKIVKITCLTEVDAAQETED
jgi:hypothetical protein